MKKIIALLFFALLVTLCPNRQIDAEWDTGYPDYFSNNSGLGETWYQLYIPGPGCHTFYACDNETGSCYSDWFCYCANIGGSYAIGNGGSTSVLGYGYGCYVVTNWCGYSIFIPNNGEFGYFLAYHPACVAVSGPY